ncbi:hypothetical protein V6N11_019575 [Hibiscus sabdariffa]|uniref:Uncharacterized protein n=2 Tax=Hibiscus sabdariffa TaxID=183260 RepID=A0ABR2A0G7_9ROSI
MLRRQRLSTEHSTPETKLRDENKGSRSLPTPKLEVNDGHATMQGKIVVSSGGEENNDPRSLLAKNPHKNSGSEE